MSTPGSRITRVRFAGLRTAASVELDLDGLTVLIGPNGVGKSSLIEGFELLRKVMTGEDFLRSIHEDHGGLGSLVTHGSNELALGFDATDGERSWTYEMILRGSDGGLGIARESLHHDGEMVILREGGKTVLGPTTAPQAVNYTGKDGSILIGLSVLRPAFKGVRAWLDGIEVHGPFTTQAAWLNRGLSVERSTRSDNVVQATTRLARGGVNLPNAFHTLRNRDDWQDTLETIRLVVDEDIRDVTTPASASGGSIGLAVKYSTGTVPAFGLSDGTLALLSLVAITSLEGGTSPRSLLVLDEPDLHLHPAAIRYVVALLERCAKRYPVVVATHSDQLLDCLADPARSTVLCDLDKHRHLRLRRPDALLLEKWLPEYRGVGHLRAEGYDSLVFPRPVRAADKP